MDQILYLAVLPLGAVLVGAIGFYLNRLSPEQREAADAEAEKEIRDLIDRMAALEMSLQSQELRYTTAIRTMAARDVATGRFRLRPEARAALSRVPAE